VLYAAFRIAIETVRQPDSQLGYLFGTDWVTMGMMLSLPMILVGAGLLVYAARTRHPQRGQEAAFERGSEDGAVAEAEGASEDAGDVSGGVPEGADAVDDADEGKGVDKATSQ
jgi:phosphatidylglycerol:prolipoprotein diacylglycerol transferase